MSEFRNNVSIHSFIIAMYILSYFAFFFIFWTKQENISKEYFVVLNIILFIASFYQVIKYLSVLQIYNKALIIKKLFITYTLMIDEITLYRYAKRTKLGIKYNELKIVTRNPYYEFVLSSTSWKEFDSIEKLLKDYKD